MRDVAVLDAAAVTDWVTRLAGTTCERLDAAELVVVIGELERVKNAAAALQARAVMALRQIREDEATARDAGRDTVTASVASEVALARHDSPHRAGRFVGLAAILAGELPHTMALFTAGELTEWRATLIARGTACLSREHRLQIDADIADHLAGWSDRQISAETNRRAYQLDPHSATARVAKAETDRRVSLRPAPDCMTQLTALLPVAQGVALYAALTKQADSDRSCGDPRSRGQIMADALIARVLGQQPGDPIGVEVHLVITDAALFRGSHTPARITGYGPLPAGTARALVRASATHNRAWYRRLYTAPDTGELVAVESKRRLFPTGMKQFIRTRDDVCRTPWCGAPIRHIDHIHPAHAGGRTTLTNAQGLCEGCNHTKEAPGWHSQANPDGTITTHTPSGQQYGTDPPPLPTENGRAPLRVDIQWAS